MNTASDDFAHQHQAALAKLGRWSREQQRKRQLITIPLDRRIAYFRLCELERIFASRYGQILPDDDAGRCDLRFAFHHIAHHTGDVVGKMVRWSRRWAPWLPPTGARLIAKDIAENPRRWKAATLGWALRLTYAERQRLRIKTIAAIDMTKAEAKRLREQRKVERNREKRRQDGIMPRQEYQTTSLSRTKPWEAEGISRATWYRRRKHA